MGLIDTYHKILERYKKFIIIFWILVLGFGAWLGPKFLDETTSNFTSPKGSPSDLAEEALKEDFPSFANETTIIIVIRSKNESENVLNSETKNFHDNIITIINNFSHQEIVLSIISYYILSDSGLELAAQELISEGNRSTLITIELNYELNKELTSEFIKYMQSEIPKIISENQGFNAYLTGFIAMYIDMKDATEEDLAMMDMIVIPIALIVLAIVLRSLKLMIIPISSMVLSVLSSFLIMYPISLTWDIFSFVPSIMMSLIIAMSIDYSLFLLSRFREEIIKKKSNSESVKLMNEHAGHTISVSGLTLAVTFLGLVFFPMQLLSTIGIGAAIAILITLVVNLTLTPSLLLSFEKFFSSFKLYKRITKKVPKTKEEMKKMELEAQMKSIWFKIGKLSTRYAPFVIIVIFIVAIPISIQVFQFDRSIDLNQILPRNSDSKLAFETLSEDFNPGQILPFYLVIRTGEVNGTLSGEFFANTISLLSNLSLETAVNNDSFTSIVRAGDFWIPYLFAYPYLDPTSPVYNTEFGFLYRIIFNRYTNQDNSTSIVEIQTPFDPYGDSSEDWVKNTRAILEDFEEETEYEIHLAEGSTTMIDAIDQVYKLFPLMISITLAVVYILIAIMFKSVFIPLRLIITVGLTLSWVYGLTIVVFKSTFFGKLSVALADVKALYWLTPVMSFSILIGLALDYDIFLLSRISEYRNLGFTEKASIHKALFKTGNIISFAGIIMAIAFSGLLLSRGMILNQFGFMLCIAVLIDTFIIRTILVPAIMSIAEKWNWWPTKKPKPVKTEEDID